jgi:hypothetical protein
MHRNRRGREGPIVDQNDSTATKPQFPEIKFVWERGRTKK